MTSLSEFRANERRNWKGTIFPYDDFIPDMSEECQYCLTEKQAEVLRGIIEPLGWQTRWYSMADTPIDEDKIQAFRDDIIRRLMMSCCGDETPILYRYDENGNLEKSTDGGITWTPSPENDPRNYSTRFPPITGEDGDDKKCLAATGAVALLKEQVGDQLTDDMSRYTLAQLITDWVKTMIDSSNPFQALLTVIANQIFALVISALRPALTDDVYETFKCILYCRMSDDASFTDEQWQGVRSDITAQISGIAGVFLEHIVFLLGVVGLTNLSRASGATSGDCSGCPDCGVPPVSFYTPALGWFTTDPVSSTSDHDIYEIISSYTGGDPENRVSILGGQTPNTYPGTECVPIRVELIDSPTADYRTTFDCAGIESGSHGMPVPDGNYTQVDLTNNPGNPPFTVRFTVFKNPIP
jgi:hypothetical protein